MNPKPVEKINDKYRARKIKAEIYLKYNVLVDLMKIVKTFGRTDKYKFDNDEKLAFIISDQSGDQNTTDKNKNMLLIDSFMTIWLLTLPAKFQEWYEKCPTLFDPNVEVIF